MTLPDRLLSSSRPLHVSITIDGVARTFSTETSSGYDGGIVDVQIGESRLDLAARRQVAASIGVRLRDDAAGSLRALFAPRARRTTWLTTTIDDADTTVLVDDTSSFAADDVIHIGAEAMSIDSVDSSTQLTVTRGKYATEAQEHVGGADDGASVYAVPPSWAGRRMRVTAYTLTLSGTPANAWQIGTYSLEAAPTYLGQQTWEVRATDLAGDLGGRQLYLGFSEHEPDEDERILWTGTNEMTVPASYADQWIDGDLDTWALLTVGGTPALFRVSQVSGGVVTFEGDDRIGMLSQLQRRIIEVGANGNGSDADPSAVTTAKHIAILEAGSAGERALIALTSRNGDSANGPYDVLPGSTPQTYGDRIYRMGAGIAESEIDDASFLAVGALLLPWSLVIDGPTTVAEVLDDLCRVTDTAWIVSRDGALTLVRLSDDASASTLTIDTSLLVSEPVVEYDEAPIAPVITIKADYDPVEGEYRSITTIADTDLLQRYPTRTDAIEIESKAICTDGARRRMFVRRQPVSRAALEVLLRRSQVADARGRCVVRCICAVPALTLSLGDVVTLDAPVPDLEGGTLSGRQARVIGHRPDLMRGTVEVTLDVMETVYVVAPSCLISSISGSDVTLSTTDPATPDATPASMFAVGWTVYVWDESAASLLGPYSIDAIAGSVITLSGAPGITAADGDTMILSTQELQAGTSASSDGYVPDDFTYQMPVDFTGADPVTRWR